MHDVGGVPRQHPVMQTDPSVVRATPEFAKEVTRTTEQNPKELREHETIELCSLVSPIHFQYDQSTIPSRIVMTPKIA